MKKNRYKLTSLGYSLFAVIAAILPVVWVSWANGQVQSDTIDSISFEEKNLPISSETTASTDSSSTIDHTTSTLFQPTNNEEAIYLLQQVTTQLSEHQSIQAELRTETFGVFKTRVSGQGEYLQSGLGENLRVHLGLDFGSNKSPMKMVQTTSEDQKYLWSSCKTPFIEYATRIDLKKVKLALQANPRSALSATPISQFTIAGLPGMVAGIAQRFDLAEVTAGSVDQRPVWIVRGKINQDALARILKDESIDWGGNDEKLAQFNRWDLLPHHLPHQVVIAIGKNDLFPYRIDFKRFKIDSKHELPQTQPQQSSPLVSISLSSVHLNQPISTAKFQMPLDIEDWQDDTVRYISSLTGKKPLASAE